MKCKCDFRTFMVGDGCDVCNPAKALEYARETIDEQAALIEEMGKALEAYRIARAMPSYGDYASILWESKAGPVNPVWGGGDCSKHGRWYGRCYCCEGEWDKLKASADKDAVHARDNALRAADELARAVLAKWKESK